MNNHNYSNTSKQYHTATNASSSAQAAANATTTDAIIIQSNSNVVTDEFIQQLQEQFGGENKQIYILNTNNTSGNTSLTSVNSNTSIASENNTLNNAPSSSTNNNNSQIQYLIVDKDVDINLILQDPSIFNQNQQPIQQQQQQQQQINMELPPKQIKSQLTQRTTTPAVPQTINNNNNQIAAMNQMLAAEESIQRVQVPPPKRKQFELKLENKKNSYQDVFLRYLAGEKQPTLEITQYEYAHNVVKKPKDNLNYSKLLNNNNNNNVTTTSNTPGTSNNSMPILSKTISTTPVVSSVNSTQSITTPTTTTATTGTTTSQVPANNLDKENYYNSSRRENLLPLNNYEYRNSYKDHYDNQGVRVNPAVLKNLSYSTTSTTTQSGVTTTSTNPAPTPIANNRAVNLPATKKISSNEVIVANNNKTIINNSILQKPELFAYSNGLADKSINNKSSNINGFDHHMKSNDLVQSTTVSTTTNKNNLTQHDELESNNVNINIEETTTTTTASNNIIEQQQQQIVDEYIDEISFLPGEFLIHKSTFSGDFDNYDIWCVRDDGYLQKYEPVLLATGERCHQSADVLAQYTPDKTEFVLVKVDEKGKTEQDNIVVGVLHNYEPKNRKIFNPQLQINNNSVSTNNNQSITSSTTSSSSSNNNTNNTLPSTIANTPAITTNTSATSYTSSTTNTTDNTNILPNTTTPSSASNNNSTSNVATSSNNTNSSVVVVTYDDLKATLDVFLQALLSQNLNSEFLVKLKEIQDEYFKPSIEFIDSILNEKYVLLMNSLSLFMTNNRDDTKNNKNQCDKSLTKQQLIQFDPLFKYLFETKPKLISQNLQSEARCKCQALVFLNNDLLYDDQYTAQYVIKFTGNSYNQDNLLPIDVTTMSDATHSTVQLDKDSINKEFLVCPKTLQFVQLGHMIKHLKINFYEICQQKIEIVKQISSNNAAPEILNDCLADTQWLIEMFEKFKQLLFEVDNLITMNQINDSSDTNNQHLESQEQNLMSHHLVVDQVMDNIQLHN